MNLLQRQLDIIEYMSKYEEWHTSQDLSVLFRISIRTIRNDISCINKEFKKDIIISSRHYGYKLDKSLYLDSVIYKPPTNFEDRLSRLLIEIITHHGNHLHFYDLADKYFISEYTLLHDINCIKNILLEYSQFNVFIEKKNDYIVLTGDLSNSIKFLHSYIKSTKIYTNLMKYDTCFEKVDLHDINAFIEDNFNIRMYTRYLTYEDLFFLVTINLEHSYYFTEDISCCNTLSYNDTVLQANKDILEFIDKSASYFNIQHHNVYSRYMLEVLMPLLELEQEERFIKMNTNESDELYSILLNILIEIKEMFCLDIYSNKQLVLDFLVHIKTAISRMKKDIVTNNPLMEYIRLNYTFLFDVAFFIAKELSKKLDISFSKDEISFFVVYLISPLKTIKNSLLQSYSIKILIYIIEGHAIAKNIMELVEENIDTKEVFLSVIQTPAELKSMSIECFDLMITTSSHFKDIEIPTCKINPLVTMFDIKKINQMISSIYEEKRHHHFHQLFDFFFHESFFETNLAYDKPNTLLQHACDKLCKAGYTPKDYYQQVIERESLISTAFDSGIALPHATKNSAFKSNISCMILPKAIEWKGRKVKAVFLFSIAKEDVDILNLIYRIIINICSSDLYASKLLKCNTFDELKSLMNTVYKEL